VNIADLEGCYFIPGLTTLNSPSGIFEHFSENADIEKIELDCTLTGSTLNVAGISSASKYNRIKAAHFHSTPDKLIETSKNTFFVVLAKTFETFTSPRVDIRLKEVTNGGANVTTKKTDIDFKIQFSSKEAFISVNHHLAISDRMSSERTNVSLTFTIPSITKSVEAFAIFEFEQGFLSYPSLLAGKAIECYASYDGGVTTSKLRCSFSGVDNRLFAFGIQMTQGSNYNI
jgi:hypothetical protein